MPEPEPDPHVDPRHRFTSSSAPSPAASSSVSHRTAAHPQPRPHTERRHVGLNNLGASSHRTTTSPTTYASNYTTSTSTLSPSHSTAISCSKPLPSVPQDVDSDDDIDMSQVLSHRPSAHEPHMESDIDTSSASASTSSSSMESDWHESNLRSQVAKLDIQYTDYDLTHTELPSVFGLRRRIVAAALDVLNPADHRKDHTEGANEPRQFQHKGLSEWLASGHQAKTSEWKEKILKKKLSFGSKKHAKAILAAQQAIAHDPMPSGANTPSDSTSRSRASSTAGSISSHDKMLKRDKELADKEANFDLVVLSRFETAHLKMTVYTEHRQGSWVVKGPAEPGAKVLHEPPHVFSPWDCQIDSKAIIQRKKLRSFVELSDTTCAVRCTSCTSIHPNALIGCKQCHGRGAVKATYVVCITLRLATFLPLTMPARHLSGKKQKAFRAYLPRTTAAMSHVDLLRMRSIEAVRSCALRVGRAHHKEHDARLLMAKATLERRCCSSVSVINRVNGLFRTFDITDGGFVRGHAAANLIEEESRIVEMPELAEALTKLPVTAPVHPEGTYRFVDLELVDMASSKVLSMVDERLDSPSVYTNASGTEDSYSPTAFSFFNRAAAGGASNDSQATRSSRTQRQARSNYSAEAHASGDQLLPRGNANSRFQSGPANVKHDSVSSSIISFSTTSSAQSFQSARERPIPSALNLALPGAKFQPRPLPRSPSYTNNPTPTSADKYRHPHQVRVE